MSKLITRVAAFVIVPCLMADPSFANAWKTDGLYSGLPQTHYFGDQALSSLSGSVTGKTKETWSHLLVLYRSLQEKDSIVEPPADRPLGLSRFSTWRELFENSLLGGSHLKEWFDDLQSTREGQVMRSEIFNISYDAFEAADAGRAEQLARIIATQIEPYMAISTYFEGPLKSAHIRSQLDEKVEILRIIPDKTYLAKVMAQKAVDSLIDLMLSQEYDWFYVPRERLPSDEERYKLHLRDEVHSWMPDLQDVIVLRIRGFITHKGYLHLIGKALQRVMLRYAAYQNRIIENRILTGRRLAPAYAALRQGIPSWPRFISSNMNICIGDREVAQTPLKFGIRAVLNVAEIENFRYEPKEGITYEKIVVVEADRISAAKIAESIAWINVQLANQHRVLVTGDAAGSIAIAWTYAHVPTCTYPQALEKVRTEARDVHPMTSLQEVLEALYPREEAPVPTPPSPNKFFQFSLRDRLPHFSVEDLDVRMQFVELKNSFFAVASNVYRSSQNGLQTAWMETKNQVLSIREAAPEFIDIGFDLILIGKRLDRLLLAVPVLARVVAVISASVGLVVFGVFADLISITTGVSQIVILASAVAVGLSIGVIGAWEATIERRLWGMNTTTRKPQSIDWTQMTRHFHVDPLLWRATIQESAPWVFMRNPLMRRLMFWVVFTIYLRSALSSEAMTLFVNAWHEIPLIMVFIALPFAVLVGFAVSFHFAPVLYARSTGRKLTWAEVTQGLSRFASRLHHESGIVWIKSRSSAAMSTLRVKLKSVRWGFPLVVTAYGGVLLSVLYMALRKWSALDYALPILIVLLAIVGVLVSPRIVAAMRTYHRSLQIRAGLRPYRRLWIAGAIVAFIALAFPPSLQGKTRLVTAA